MMVALTIIAYIVGVLVTYYWWVKECIKYNEHRMDADDLAEMASESGFFFSMFWFIFVPIYWVMEIIEWIKRK